MNSVTISVDCPSDPTSSGFRTVQTTQLRVGFELSERTDFRVG